MTAAVAAWAYVLLEELGGGWTVWLATQAPRRCQSYALSLLFAERATPIQVMGCYSIQMGNYEFCSQVCMLASAVICTGIAMDRHQSITGQRPQIVIFRLERFGWCLETSSGTSWCGRGGGRR